MKSETKRDIFTEWKRIPGPYIVRKFSNMTLRGHTIGKPEMLKNRFIGPIHLNLSAPICLNVWISIK